MPDCLNLVRFTYNMAELKQTEITINQEEKYREGDDNFQILRKRKLSLYRLYQTPSDPNLTVFTEL